ncbi:MAG: cupredoxin domain-containing protein [Acidimicrobiales bacterium]
MTSALRSLTGYSPSAVLARAGIPTELTLRTNGNRGRNVDPGLGILGLQRLLPFTGNTRIDLGRLEPGTHRYTCGIGMYSGTIEVVA